MAIATLPTGPDHACIRANAEKFHSQSKSFITIRLSDKPSFLGVSYASCNTRCIMHLMRPVILVVLCVLCVL